MTKTASALSSSWSEERLLSLQQHSLLQQHSWSQQWGAQQLDEFIARGFPSRRDELWKYTATDKIAAQPFEWPTLTTAENQAALMDLTAYRIHNSVRYVFVNGYFSAALSDAYQFPAGVNALNLAAAWQQVSQRCQHFCQSVAAVTPIFSTLNSALVTDGWYLSVADNVQLVQPIHLLHINTADANHSMQHPRHLIELGQNSSAQIIEEYVAINAGVYLRNSVTQIELAPQAQLHHYKLQRESVQAFHMAHIVVNQQQDSQAYFYYLGNGGNISREDLHIKLQQRGAHCELNGLFLAKNKQHSANYSRIDHIAPHTQSEQHYRGVITDQAQGVFNGKVMAHPGAIKTSAKQLNHNLLLSQQAVINTKPELEIYVDDISCSHGATVGQLDETALFYMQSRGIDVNRAREILTQGFAQQVLETLPEGAITDYFQLHIATMLRNMIEI